MLIVLLKKACLFSKIINCSVIEKFCYLVYDFNPCLLSHWVLRFVSLSHPDLVILKTLFLDDRVSWAYNLIHMYLYNEIPDNIKKKINPKVHEL